QRRDPGPVATQQRLSRRELAQQRDMKAIGPADHAIELALARRLRLPDGREPRLGRGQLVQAIEHAQALALGTAVAEQVGRDAAQLGVDALLLPDPRGPMPQPAHGLIEARKPTRSAPALASALEVKAQVVGVM